MKPAVLIAVVALILSGCAMGSSPRAVNAPRASASMPAGGVVTVRPGDNVYLISQRYGVSPRDIIDTNGLRPPYLLRPGDRLQLPGASVHVVRSGDTVSEIAERYGVSTRAIVVANNLRAPYVIHVGDRLRLPSAGRSTPARNSTVTVASRQPRAVPQPPVVASDVSPPRAVPPGSDGKPWSANGRLHFPVSGGAQRVAATSPSGAPLPQLRPTGAADAPRTTSTRTVSTGTTATPAAVPRVTPASQTRTVSLTPPSRAGRGFTWPVKGRVISGFGPREGGLHNDGINILAPAGSEVRAAENGIVVYAGNELRGFGNLLLVKHDDGYTTAYAHADRLLVNRGDKVRRGDVIATVGQTGNVSEPQLHFEIRKGPRPVDPRKELPPAQVSMLVVK